MKKSVRLKVFCLLLLSSLKLCSENEFKETLDRKLQEQISYHLLIRDYTKASEMATDSVRQIPQSKSLRKLHMQALAQLGAEKKLLQAWQQFSRDFPEDKYEDGLLEWVAKGIFRKAEVSDPYSSKKYRYAVAGNFTDSSSVEALSEALSDTNFEVRSMALDAALSHGDEVLCDDILELLERERIPAIKFKAMQVLMRIKGEEVHALADEMIKDPQISFQERLHLILMRLDSQKIIPREELEQLTQSTNMVERLIAAYAFGYFNRKEDLDLLYRLISDPILDVRQHALCSLGLLRVKEIDGHIVTDLMRPIIENDSPQLSLIASWVAMLAGDIKAKQDFRDFIYHTNQKMRLEATSLICYSLPYTMELAEEFFQTHQDEYVRLNLSVHLLTHRKRVQEASNELFTFIKGRQSAQFKLSVPYPMEMIWPVSLIDDFDKMVSGVPPVIQNEVVHFCLMNLLTLVDDTRAEELISHFLETHHSAIALATMPQFMRAGSAKLMDQIRSFFDHPDLMKRIQAAALVALLKKDEKALQILYDLYPEVDRPLKETILSIAGQIGSKDSIPFLMDAVYEPSQSLRIIAASSLMQCLRN